MIPFLKEQFVILGNILIRFIAKEINTTIMFIW